MFQMKPPDLQKLKAEYERKQHQKNNKALFKLAKKSSSSGRKKLKRAGHDLKAAAEDKSTPDSSFPARKTQPMASTSAVPKLSSHFKIPKKVPPKTQPSGPERQLQHVKPTPPTAPAVVEPPPVRSVRSNPQRRLDSASRCGRPEELVLPQLPTKWWVEQWLTAGEDGGTKNPEFRSIPVVEDNNNSVEMELEEEPMVIDIEEVVGSVHQIRGANMYDGGRVCGQLTGAMSVITDQTCTEREMTKAKEILLVLDTNVLASELGTVDDLKRTWNGDNGSIKLVLVLPWIVLQELDRLKDDKMDKNPAMKTLAAGAVRYLHGLLISCDSQMRGQTIQETSEDLGWEITCNDDWILHCCLQYKKKGKSEVILFSNDRNLCNKAMVNGVHACSNDTIFRVVQRLAPLPATRKKMLDMCWDGKVESGTKLCDEIFCQLKRILFEILETVLKNEMYKAFDEQWMSVVKIRPPWRLEDILKCLQSHWIAVFGMFLPRNAKKHLDIIRAKFTVTQAALSKDDLKALLIASIWFLTFFESKPEYSERVTPCIHQMRSMLEVVKNIRLTTYQQKAGESAPRAHATAGQDAVPECGDELDPEAIEEVPPCPHEQLRTSLHNIWNFMNNTCGLIFDTIGMTHPVNYQRPDKRLAREEALAIIPHLYSTMTEFGKLLEIVLRLGPGASREDEAFAKLAMFVDNFFVFLGKESDIQCDEVISLEAVYMFCTTEVTRRKLVAAFHQLEDFCNLMYRCIILVKDIEASMAFANVSS